MIKVALEGGVLPALVAVANQYHGIAHTDIGFERYAAVESPYATHLRFRVV